MKARVVIQFLLVLLMSCGLFSCSTKKNTAGSRFWHAFNTRYNVYYNGDVHYKEQLHELETKYEDNYSQLLFMHPAEAYANPKATQPSTNFDRTIEKMQKAIQLHSIKKRPKKKSGKSSKDKKYKEWLKREEYNPFLHNAWYMMAKAQYMKGDFLAAAATFHYISGHFSWLPDLVNDAKLWEARSYCAMGWLTEAENMLAYMKPEKITNKKTKELFNLAFASYYVKSKKYKEAAPYLTEAAKAAKGAQKVRLHFLLGQIYTDMGEKTLAYEAFKKAGSATGTTYRTKLNARIKQSAVYTGNNVNSEVRALKKMTRFDRNKDYLDQIYYAIGNLYLTRGDTANAIANYALGAEKSTRNGVDKGIVQLALGELYFAQGMYDEAQPCYSEGITLVNDDYPGYKEMKRRSDVLDELAVYSQNVVLQDSLLKLSELSVEEQTKVAERIIDELKKKEKEEAENAKREEYLANQAAAGNTMTSNTSAPTTFQINNDDSWYFYNTATKNAGKTAFQKAWGSRKLEDDWRRRNKTTIAQEISEEDMYADNEDGENGDNSTQDSTAVDGKTKEDLAKADDPHYVEYYLKQIPKTEEEKQNSNDIIQEGLYNMGLILKDKLEDYPSSAKEFNELMSRYPDNVYRLDVYYNMYLMYMRIGDLAMAEKYRTLITTEFAESKYGVAMKDSNYLDNLRNMESDQEVMYEHAYNDYINNNNAGVHEAYAEMMRKYPMSKIMPKFMFIDALSYVTEKNYDKFKSTLKEMLERYPETDMTQIASSMLKQAEQGRKIEGGGYNVRGILWATRLTSDTTAVADGKEVTPFKDAPESPQVYVMVYPTDSVSANQLLFDVAKHNFSRFVVKDFDLEQMTFGRLGLLVIKGFANFEELSHYKRVLEENTDLVIPAQVRQVMISVDNFNLLLNEGRSFEEYFEFLEQENVENVESSAEPE